MTTLPLLQINNLRITFPAEGGTVTAVDGITFSLRKGETLGIVGESGSGKSMTALSILGLLPPAGKLAAGEILFQEEETAAVDLLKLPPEQRRQYRGSRIAMIFQEPMTSLNPVLPCGEQVAEAIPNSKFQIPNSELHEHVLALFGKVKLPDPERIYRSFPHQLSGGQRQRVMIAMALANNPSLLIADEPTSALDVTVQRSILQLINELKSEWGGSTIFITHDLGVVAQVADRVLVMQKGKVVEEGSVSVILKTPSHPYTQDLLKNYRERAGSEKTERPAPAHPILSIRNLRTWFPGRRSFFGKTLEHVKAVDDVSLDLYAGETLGVVGESGSGKTTLGRSILHLLQPNGGEVVYRGKDLTHLPETEWKPLRKDLQIIFQDPYSSLNPRYPVGIAITEPMRVHGILTDEKERRERALQLLETVGLEAAHFWRYPGEFSGGQRQRIALARALAVEPKIIVCDECVSSLDVTVQAQVLGLLKDLQRERELTYLFISHDLSVVRFMSDRIAVMKEGKVVECGTATEVFHRPKASYTLELLDAVPGNFNGGL
jgi:peptide/nickel transport system ATP-binding protein